MGKTNNNGIRRLLALILSFIMAVTLAVPFYVQAAAAGDVSALLTNVKAAVSQSGAVITDGTKIDSTKALDISFSFGVPVLGDGFDEVNDSGKYVKQGDAASFSLAKGYTLSGGTQTFTLKQGANKVGTLQIVSENGELKANVTFDGDAVVFNGDMRDVVCNFNCQLQYDPTGSAGSEGDHNTMILSKTYVVTVPQAETKVTASKSGHVNGDNVDWVIPVTARKNEQDTSLNGLTFSDDLSTVGAYVAGSFKVGTKSDGSDAAAVTPVYASETGHLSYAFSQQDSGSVVPLRRFFQGGVASLPRR